MADENGFIRIKELLKAVNEEEGFRYVRRSHLDEIMLTLSEPAFEIVGNAIRSNDWDCLLRRIFQAALAKLLYTSVS